MTANRRSWRRRRVRAAAALAAGFLVAIWACRRIGLGEEVSGALLITSVGGVLAALATGLAWPGVRRREGAGWALALLLASSGPTLASIRPGPELGQAMMQRVGDRLDVDSDMPATVRVSISASIPERSSVHFTLRVGTALIEDHLARGARRWAAGPESRYYHEDRTAVMTDARLQPGVRRLVLERITAGAPPLRVRVYGTWLPWWLPWLAATGVWPIFAWRAAPLGDKREVCAVAGLLAVTGLGAGATATPEFAFGGVIAGLALGLVAGIPLGAATAAIARWPRSQKA